MILIESQNSKVLDTNNKGPITNIRILTGYEVMSLMENDVFRYKWDVLYQACPWATVFQSKEFVSAWYKLYHQMYLPILLMSENGNQLTGLLTLALPKASVKSNKHPIVGAGHWEADYQTWLATAPHSDSFVSAALLKVKELFPDNDVVLRHLPANTPIEWSQINDFWKKHCVLQSFRCPLIVCKESKVSRRDRKRINRLKSIAHFEKITEEKDFVSILPEVAANYDFRQGAMFNKNPFRNDHLKEEFLLSQFRNNLLHLTVLKSDKKIIASVAALIGKNKAYLGGINFHSPLYADYSPGFVHFLMLGQQMAAEDIESFDLTPGEDPYKERLATMHDTVHILTFAVNSSIRRKRIMQKKINAYLIQAGMRYMSVELGIKKNIYHLKKALLSVKQIGLLKTLNDQVKAAWYARFPKAYLIKTPRNPNSQTSVKQDNLHDLLDFESRGTSLTRWGFLEDAMLRMESGEHAFTLAREGRLLACAWLRVPEADANIGRFTLPDRSAALHGIYCHPDHTDELDSFLLAAAQTITSDPNIDEVYAVADNRFGKLIQQARVCELPELLNEQHGLFQNNNQEFNNQSH